MLNESVRLARTVGYIANRNTLYHNIADRIITANETSESGRFIIP